MSQSVEQAKPKNKKLMKLFGTLLLTAGILLVGGYNFFSRMDFVSTPVYSEGSTPSIQVPYNRVVLVRSGVQYGAFIIRGAESSGGFLNGASYEFWYQEDGTGNLTKTNVQNGIGSVYEKYTEAQAGPAQVNLTDVGSQLNIKVGPLWVEWSSNNHVYPRPYLGTGNFDSFVTPLSPIEIAATPWTDIKDVNGSFQGLKWIGQAPSNRK